MSSAGVPIAILLVVVAFLVAIPFLPLIQEFTANSTSLNETLISSGFSETPFAPIMNLWPLWGLILIIICGAIIFVAGSKSG